MQSPPAPQDIELEYRSTFIDVKCDHHEARVRSKSCPVHSGRRDFDLDAHAAEEQMKGYVNDLNYRAEDFGHHEDEAVNPEETCREYLDAPDEGIGSMGSVGHPEVCRRRCVHFARGNCQSGVNCGYCHLPHLNHEPKLDKKQRAILDALPQGQLLNTALTFLYRRAQEKHMLEAAQPILAIYEQARGAAAAAEQRIKKLDRVLSRMSFGALLSLSSHRLGEELHQQIAEAEEALRHVLEA